MTGPGVVFLGRARNRSGELGSYSGKEKGGPAMAPDRRVSAGKTGRAL